MGDLIWIGNTLLPRGLVIAVFALAVFVVIGAFTYLTRERRG